MLQDNLLQYSFALSLSPIKQTSLCVVFDKSDIQLNQNLIEFMSCFSVLNRNTSINHSFKLVPCVPSSRWRPDRTTQTSALTSCSTRLIRLRAEPAGETTRKRQKNLRQMSGSHWTDQVPPLIPGSCSPAEVCRRTRRTSSNPPAPQR